jgi:hypothetical protein
MLRRFTSLILMIVIALAVIYGLVGLYVIPRWVGDSFTRGLQTGDAALIADTLCPELAVAGFATGGTGAILSSLGLDLGADIRNAAFNPLTRVYTFDWHFGGVGGISFSQPLRLDIPFNGLFGACVSAINRVT